MDTRELGSSGVEVSEIGFGAWVLGTDWWGDRSRDEAVELLQHALDRGVTFVDTADVYGHGNSEQLIGEVLDEVREEVALGTKVGYDFYANPQAGHGELPKKMDPDYLYTAFERSLDRLGVEYVDLLQLHNANVAEVDADVLAVLDQLQEAGRVDAVGWALGPSIGWLADGDAAIEHDFDAVQTVYNVLEQTAGGHFIETIRRTQAETKLIARVPHSSGVLNEQVQPDTELGDGDHRAHRPAAWFEAGWEKLEQLRFLERDGERTMAQAAIQWLLAHEEVASVTPTFRTKADIDEWAAAVETPPLSTEEFERVASLSAQNFGVDRDDGMSVADLRSSVGGQDLEAAGLVADD